jgi:hypothetical protein
MTAGLVDAGSGDRGDVTGHPSAVDVAFVVGHDGMLRLEPTANDERVSWTCTWAPSRLVVSSPTPVPPAPPLGETLWAGADLPLLPALPSSRRRAREMSPPLELGEALGRAERIVSRQVGRIVAIRSASALFGCIDRDERAVLDQRADRLDRALDLCGGVDAVHVVRAASDVARRALDGPSGRVFAGGSFHDVAREIERVIEHLGVMIGTVTPAERNRLVRDAELLGFDHERARSLVDELINDTGVDSDGPADDLRDPTAAVVVSASGFRLAPWGVRLDPDQAAIRVLLFER